MITVYKRSFDMSGKSFCNLFIIYLSIYLCLSFLIIVTNAISIVTFCCLRKTLDEPRHISKKDKKGKTCAHGVILLHGFQVKWSQLLLANQQSIYLTC